MRIALVGNLNNNFSSMLKWLRIRGFDAHLFYTPVPHYFHAAADTLDISYLDYCHEIDWVRNGFRPALIKIGDIRSLLQSFDKIIAQGNEAAVLNFCDIPIDIYFPYGTDISKYAHLPHAYTFLQRVRLLFRKNSGFTWALSGMGTFAKYLHNAIASARYVFMDIANPEYEETLKRIPLQGEFKYVPMPFIFYPEYEKVFSKQAQPSVHWRDSIDRIREVNEFIVLYHGRQYWKDGTSKFASKANDVLIRGFAEFISYTNNVKAHLVMLNFGPDVAHSKKLIEELGISAYVTWFPQMYRKDIMYIISKVDVGSGEFGRSYLTFGTVIENMIMGKPVIHYRDDELYKKQYPWLYPLINVRTPSEVREGLKYYSTHKDELVKMGAKAQEWVKEFFIERPLIEIINTLRS